MKLYHGTKKEYLPSIMKDGLKRDSNGGDTVYIYTAETIDEAKKWGDTVLEIDATGLDTRCFPDENPVWQVLVKDDVSPDRLALKERPTSIKGN